MDRLTFSEKEAPFEITAYVDRVGDDLLILVSGGEPHVGAVGIAHARASLLIPEKQAAQAPSSPYPGTRRM